MTNLLARIDPILGGWADGWEHKRDEFGFCVNCGATRAELHYRLVPRDNVPIYRKLIRR